MSEHQQKPEDNEHGTNVLVHKFTKVPTTCPEMSLHLQRNSQQSNVQSLKCNSDAWTIRLQDIHVMNWVEQ